MIALLLGTAGIAVASLIGWALMPDRAPAFAAPTLLWIAYASAVVFLLVAVLRYVRYFQEGREARTKRRTDRADEAKILADRVTRAATMVQGIVQHARALDAPLEDPVGHYHAELRDTLKELYEQVHGEGYRSDGVERELGGIRTVENLERLSTALRRLSQEIANSS